LPWEHECDGRIRGQLLLSKSRPVAPSLEDVDRIRRVSADEHPSMLKMPSARLQRVCYVRQVDIGRAFEVAGQTCADLIESSLGLCRQHDQVRRIAGVETLSLRRLFQDHVCVGTTHAKSTHACAAWEGAILPRTQFRVYVERAVRQIQSWVRLLK